MANSQIKQVQAAIMGHIPSSGIIPDEGRENQASITLKFLFEKMKGQRIEGEGIAGYIKDTEIAILPKFQNGAYKGLDISLRTKSGHAINANIRWAGENIKLPDMENLGNSDRNEIENALKILNGDIKRLRAAFTGINPKKIEDYRLPKTGKRPPTPSIAINREIPQSRDEIIKATPTQEDLSLIVAGKSGMIVNEPVEEKESDESFESRMRSDAKRYQNQTLIQALGRRYSKQVVGSNSAETKLLGYTPQLPLPKIKTRIRGRNKITTDGNRPIILPDRSKLLRTVIEESLPSPIEPQVVSEQEVGIGNENSPPVQLAPSRKKRIFSRLFSWIGDRAVAVGRPISKTASGIKNWSEKRGYQGEKPTLQSPNKQNPQTGSEEDQMKASFVEAIKSYGPSFQKKFEAVLLQKLRNTRYYQNQEDHYLEGDLKNGDHIEIKLVGGLLKTFITRKNEINKSGISFPSPNEHRLLTEMRAGKFGYDYKGARKIPILRKGLRRWDKNAANNFLEQLASHLGTKALEAESELKLLPIEATTRVFDLQKHQEERAAERQRQKEEAIASERRKWELNRIRRARDARDLAEEFKIKREIEKLPNRKPNSK